MMQAATPPAARALPAVVDFGRDICGDLAAAEAREWLVTNGIGGFACGTVAGTLTRRYHGLLMAALKPPLGRTLLVAKFDEAAKYHGTRYALSANRWAGGAVDSAGVQYIERFRMEGVTPVWTLACADALIEKRIWMAAGFNTTYVQYQLTRGDRALELTVKALVNYRDYHGTTHAGDWRMEVERVARGLKITAFEGATPFQLLSATAGIEAAHEWYRDFTLPVEHERGLDDHEDHLHCGTFTALLEPGEVLTLAATAEASCLLNGPRAYRAHVERQRDLLELRAQVKSSAGGTTVEHTEQLALAADQFIVKRALRDQPDAHSVIAGYPWFGDWGRDTMIALPGLTLATGRPEIAKSILGAFAHFVDRGMLPNVFGDDGEAPEYNTADAALWYIEAIRQYYAATRDRSFLQDLFPVLVEIVDWHVRGTRYNIHADAADGLLYAGQEGVQVTWMDAKLGDWVVTPRIGKPVEINALWLNALVTMTQLARELGQPIQVYEALAEKARAGFARFWNPETQFCYDVLDGPGGNDATLRPNQIFAVSLPESGLSAGQQRAVVEMCARRLLSSHGLRSLDPEHPDYHPHYGGGPRERDSAYHQGTVWGWLVGPFALAHFRVYQDAGRAASFLTPMFQHLEAYGLGTLGEIFDGEPPFAPRGCFAQAWTVAEILRAHRALTGDAESESPRRNPTVSP